MEEGDGKWRRKIVKGREKLERGRGSEFAGFTVQGLGRV